MLHCLMQSETEAFTPTEYVQRLLYSLYDLQVQAYSWCQAERPHGGSQGASRTHAATVRDSHSNHGCSIPEGEAANSNSRAACRPGGTAASRRPGRGHELSGGGGTRQGTGRERDQFGRGSRRHCGREELARPNLNLEEGAGIQMGWLVRVPAASFAIPRTNSE